MKHIQHTIAKHLGAETEIENALRTIKGCQFIRMQAITNAGLRLTRDTSGKRVKHEHGQIQKFTDGQFLVGFRYENSLNNQANREGKKIQFNVQDRVWGEHIENTCLIQLGANLYVETLPINIFHVSYLDAEGNHIEKSEIQDLIDAKKEKRQKSSTQSNLEKEVIVRDYKLANIKYLVANHYTIGQCSFYAGVENTIGQSFTGTYSGNLKAAQKLIK